MSADDLLKWSGGILPFVVLLGGWLVNRQLNRANAEKTQAEARLAEANVDRAATDVQATILANTKSLLDEARALQNEKDAIKGERIATLVERVNKVENRFEALRTILASHGIWDATALVDLRETKPDYPEPPPLDKYLPERRE